jgi:predicted RecB family nuclease
MFLTDHLFLNYQRCSRRAFLDTFGDLDVQDAPSDYLLKLRQDNVKQHKQILAPHSYVRPDYPRDDWLAGAAATLGLMTEGVDVIHQGVLAQERPDGVILVSRPDLLIKWAGVSELGNWQYGLVDIRLGKRPKLEYQTSMAFHAYVLTSVQGVCPTSARLFLRDRDPYGVKLPDVLPQMEKLLGDCIQMLLTTQEPEVFIARNRCNLCQWSTHCHTVAREQDHLSLLPGVTPSRYGHLRALDVGSSQALSAMSPAVLEPLPGFGRDLAHRLVRQAQSVVHNQAVPFLTSPSGVKSPQPGLTVIPASMGDLLTTAPYELYFDIEAEPDCNLAYLHGVLVIDHLRQSEQFHSFLVEDAAEEGQIWEQLLTLVEQYPTAPIFHFCPYELQTVKRLGQLFKTSPARMQQLLPRFVDLHAWITQSVALPVESYALKPIARWLGFEWSDASANGAQSIYWYSQWLETGDRAFLELILRYNEDDCRATYHVKAWLASFLDALTLVPCECS